MGQRRIRLDGFEEALAGAIAAGFRFPDATLQNLALEAGRHLFVNDMPEVEAIAKTATDFDEKTEPQIGIYTTQQGGILPSVSSGARHEWNLRIIVRAGKVFERVKELLEHLVKFLIELKGKRATPFLVKHVQLTSRPQPFERKGDDRALASSTLKFLAVPLPY